MAIFVHCSKTPQHPNSEQDSNSIGSLPDNDTNTKSSQGSEAEESGGSVGDSTGDGDSDSDETGESTGDGESDGDSDDSEDSNSESNGDSGDSEDLLESLKVVDVAVPEGVMEGVRNWRVWKTSSLKISPVFSVPSIDGSTLVGYTTKNGDSIVPRVSRINADNQLSATYDLGEGLECRGIASEPDGHFAALLWSKAKQQIYMARFTAEGEADWNTELTNESNTPTGFGIGESRVEYGDGKYGAYYHVHSDTGHEGDTLKWVSADNGAESTGWSWGCSHSMSNLLRFHPDLNEFMSSCVTDCYPGTSGSDFETSSIGGIYVDRKVKIMDVDAGCNGKVAGELGSAAIGPENWKVVFNAHQAPATLGQSSYDPDSMNQDIGFSVSSKSDASDVVWLTNTEDVNEADSSIARWGSSKEQYVVGWLDQTNNKYMLGVVDGSGQWIENPVDITGMARWGLRDDPFRRHANGDIVWAWFEKAGDKILRFARLRSGR